MGKVVIDFDLFLSVLCELFSVDIVLMILDNLNDNDVFLEDLFEVWSKWYEDEMKARLESRIFLSIL